MKILNHSTFFTGFVLDLQVTHETNRKLSMMHHKNFRLNMPHVRWSCNTFEDA